MAVNVKLGVEFSQFTAGMREGQTQLKGLKAEMKATEAEFKSTGNAEKALADKTKILTNQMKTQREIADNAEKALKEMTNAGIKPTEEAYQKLYVQMMNARAGMNEAQASLNELSAGQLQAATSADKLTGSLSGISKKMSLDQVTSGIETITRGLETAAQKAVQLGQSIWDEIMNSAKWADDTATMAQMYGIDLDTFLRMQKLVTNGMDTSVEAILTSQSKLEKGMATGSQTVQEAMEALGLSMYDMGVAGKYGMETTLKDSTDLFWEAGQAIMGMTDAYKQEEYAQAIFGRSWHDLVPLFTQFKDRESFTAALGEVNVESEDTVTKLAELNDKIGELEGNFNTLKTTVLGSLAEPLSQAADAVSGLLTSLLEYLQKPEGQKMLEDLGTAVSGLFDDLGKIDPEEVVKGFTGVFDTIVDGLKWLDDNKETLAGVLGTIVGGWALATLSGGAADVLMLINGLTSLGSASTIAAATTGGTLAGQSWATAFGVAVKAILPGLIITFLANELIDKLPDDFMTQLGEKLGIKASEEEKTINEINDRAGIETIGDLKDQIQQETDRGRNPAKRVFDYIFGVGDASQYAEPTEQKTHSSGRVRHITGVGELPTATDEFIDLDEAETMVRLTEDQAAAAQKYWDIMRDGATSVDQQSTAYQDLLDHFIGDDASMAQMTALLSLIESLPKSFEDLPDWWWKPGEDDLIVEPEVDIEEAQAQLDANPLTVPVIPQMWGSGSVWGSGGGGAGGKWLAMPKANGIWSVPYDGYLTALHRGEQVVPAREISSRNYSSNLYVESMVMNNGMDADGLAARMAAEQRRMMSGYGS